jgi:hypothetical protein
LLFVYQTISTQDEESSGCCKANAFPFAELSGIDSFVPKQRQAMAGDNAGPQKIKRKAIMFRLTEEDVRKLGEAAFRAGLNKTVYVQLALREKFKKDNVD